MTFIGESKIAEVDFQLFSEYANTEQISRVAGPSGESLGVAGIEPRTFES